MKILTKKKQIECIKRLMAIRIITDDMNFIANEDNIQRWAEDMEYLADNIISIAEIIDGIVGMMVIAEDMKTQHKGEKEQKNENRND